MTPADDLLDALEDLDALIGVHGGESSPEEDDSPGDEKDSGQEELF